MSELLGPQQVILVTSRAEIEQFGKKISKDDIETAFWHTPVSKDDLLYAVCLNNSKHILKIIKESGIFCVNFLQYSMEKKVHKCNLMHGEHSDKFKILGFEKAEAGHIECPYIKEACAHLECTVVQTVVYKDFTLFIAKIINSNVKNVVKRLFHLQNNEYTTTKDI